MIVQIVDNCIRMEWKEAYLKAAKRFMEDSRANDKGCLEAAVYLDDSRKDHVYMISKWERREDMENCLQSGSFPLHVAELVPAFISNEDTILELM